MTDYYIKRKRYNEIYELLEADKDKEFKERKREFIKHPYFLESTTLLLSTENLIDKEAQIVCNAKFKFLFVKAPVYKTFTSILDDPSSGSMASTYCPSTA